MYHDEFAPRPVGNRGDFGGRLTGLAIELGGGASGATASAIALPDLPILLAIGGLLPFVACCLGILVERCSEAVAALLARFEAGRLAHPLPLAPAIGDRAESALRGPRGGLRSTRVVRAGFDRSRTLG